MTINKEDNLPQYTFKTLMLGNKGVGKSTLTYRYITGEFKSNLKQTLGVDIFTKYITFTPPGNSNFGSFPVKFQIWDFGGEERFRSILPRYCQGTNAAFILYDTTELSSYIDVSTWIKFTKKNTEDIPIILVGTKIDLNEQREVSYEQGKNLAEEFQVRGFLEISALTGENVKILFENLLIYLFEDRNLME